MKRILVCTESSFLSSGYAIYGREIMKRLHKKYEIAEHGAYGSDLDPRVSLIPWKFYGNLPVNEEEQKRYSDGPDVYGAFKFEQVCLDFQPTHIISFRDIWMDTHIINSPFRKLFKHIWMPAHDSSPSQENWINDYASADCLITYQAWSKEQLEQRGLKVFGYASPAAEQEFQPINDSVKEKLGIDPDLKVIGTVMRNQRRKLFPELFRSFRQYLDKYGRKDIVLLCHTSYPETGGWNFPQLLKEFSLSSKVYFTYMCNECGAIAAMPFLGPMSICNKCGKPELKLPNVQHSVDNSVLSVIYNAMDLYVQYCTNEGFGMPLCEAAACGVPVAGSDYSALEDVLEKLDGYKIPCDMWRELETGSDKALPKCEEFVEILNEFFKLPDQLRKIKGKKTHTLFEKYYSWDKTAEIWMDAVESVEPPNVQWNEDYDLHNVPPIPDHSRWSNPQYARWLIGEVLRDTSKVGSYLESRILRDLNYGYYLSNHSHYYYSDASMLFKRPTLHPFNRELAYKEMSNIRGKINYWENERFKLFS